MAIFPPSQGGPETCRLPTLGSLGYLGTRSGGAGDQAWGSCCNMPVALVQVPLNGLSKGPSLALRRISGLRGPWDARCFACVLVCEARG